MPALSLVLVPGGDVPGVGAYGNTPLRAFYVAGHGATPEPCQVEVVRLQRDLFSRLQGIYGPDMSGLASKTVAVIGVGSGGSLAALELAKAGVGHFLLVDHDRLTAHNVPRHACGLRDVGRFKTRAVRDLLLDRNPAVSVDCHEKDITQDSDLLMAAVDKSDLVVVATDTELSKYLINEVCLVAERPAVYAGAYSRAYAGEVVRIVPGETGCYACVRQTLVDTVRALAEDEGDDYTAPSEPVKAEPGLGLDVGMIALLQARVALLTLLRGTGTLEDLDADIILWVNRARPEEGGVFTRPLSRYFARVRPLSDCPVCRGGKGTS
ncbi:MAG: ThiF family adenylyltransferase [Chloroflexi bacterium]|nr:ThiF family adenylyltransferase [Chloroflexota bacterium]